MNFEELLKHQFLRTPKSRPERKDFIDFFNDTLDEYLDLVDQLDDIDTIITRVRYKPRFVQKTLRLLIEGLKECVLKYMEGNINESYITLGKTLQHEQKNFYEILKQTEIPEGVNFYRIREKRENYMLAVDQMFHIPFELRGCVTNQRYSINGFPSLYLASNLYTCWEELKRPELSNFQAIRFKNNETLTVLDLTPPDLNHLFTRENYRYVLVWPIIFACSIKVKNTKDVFKPEYIIPQLLLQWVRENDYIDCIRYFSTNIEKFGSKSKGDFSNFVFPVKKMTKKGHCSALKEIFEHTEVISWQSVQMATGGQNFSHSTSEFDEINRKIPKLEIIKNMAYPYSYSILGKLEFYLDQLKTQTIKF